MDGKKIVGIALIVGIIAIALAAAPIQAYINRANGDSIKTQEQDGLRIQNRDGTCNCVQTQHRYRERVNDCATNGICNCTQNMEQCRNQNRERIRSQGN